MQAFLQSFFSLPPELLTALGTVLGFAALGDLNGDQQNTLGNFLMLIGQVLETNSAQLQLLEDLASAQQMRQLRQEVEQLKQALAQMQNSQGSPPSGHPPGSPPPR